MKKQFVVCDLDGYKKYEKSLKRCQIVGFRATDPSTKNEVFVKKNLSFLPENFSKMSYSQETEELTIKIKIQRGQFLALGDGSGISKKEIIGEDKNM